jgi:hypothetical protein
MTRWLSSLILIATLSSCTAIDRAADKGGELVVQFRKEMGTLKTETLNEVDKKLEIIVPRAINRVELVLDNFLNSDVVAFVIVSATALLGAVVLVALFLLIGTARAWWRRKRCQGCSSAKEQASSKQHIGF